MRETIKFQLQDLLPIGMTLVVFGIAVTYGLDIMGDVQDDTCPYGEGSTPGTCLNSSGGTLYVNYNYAHNASGNALEGVAKLPEKLPTIATVVVAAIVIGILVTYLWQRMR